MSDLVLKTSEEWSKDEDLVVLDPDGWDRFNFEYSWFKECISYREFTKRMLRSTVEGKIKETKKNRDYIISEITRQKISEQSSNRVSVMRNEETKYIKKEELASYEEKGYIIKGSCKGRIWVCNRDHTKMVKSEELSYYISLGYIKGRNYAKNYND